MTITQKAVAAQVRPLRETVERSLDWEGRFTQPAPVQIGAYTVSVAVVYQRGVRIPFAIWYRASLDGRTVIEVDRQPEFVRLLTARLNKEAL